MRYKDMPVADDRPDDEPVFREAIRKLNDAGAQPRRPQGNDSQIKVKTLNYYPTTGRIVPDGERSLSVTGIDAFIARLREDGMLPDCERP